VLLTNDGVILTEAAGNDGWSHSKKWLLHCPRYDG